MESTAEPERKRSRSRSHERTHEQQPVAEVVAAAATASSENVSATGPPVGGPRTKGVVARWSERGFGFITPPDGAENLFCHVSSLSDGNCLVEGAAVEYELQFDEKKQKDRAVNITGCSKEDRRAGGGGAAAGAEGYSAYGGGAYGGGGGGAYGGGGGYGGYGMGYGAPGYMYGQQQGYYGQGGYGEYGGYGGGYGDWNGYGYQAPAYPGRMDGAAGAGAGAGGGRNALYKTRMCHVVGTCRFGDRCNFAHDQSELRQGNGAPAPAAPQ